MDPFSYKLIKSIRDEPIKYKSIDIRKPEEKIKELLKEERYRNFIKEIKNFDNVIVYEDSDFIINNFDYLNSPYTFKNTLKDLVRSELIECSYWPQRSRAGKRKSQAAQTRYKLSDDGKKLISDILIETIIQSNDEKGELEYLVEEFEQKIEQQ